MAAKQILRKEHFGGILRDLAVRGLQFLTPLEYKAKAGELIDAQRSGKNVLIFDATQEGYPLLENAASSPLDLYLELTKRCNGACTHCFADSIASRSEPDEMAFAEIASIVRQLAGMGGMYVRLTGGEPTIRDDFFDIVDLVLGE